MDSSFVASPPLPRGTVTFFLTDIEGSTRLWELQDSAPAAIARHYELLEAVIALHGGVRPLEQGEGDSVVGAFTQPSDAIAAAVDAQRAFSKEPWPGDTPLRIRIAIHTGEAQLRDDRNYFGPAIIRAARLRAIAHGGQTILSDATCNVVAGRTPGNATLRDLGRHRLKDLGRPERVWQLCDPDFANEFPPLRSLDSFPNNLPAQVSSFIGREAELAALRAALTEHRIVTISGAGGCGKTQLALHTAADAIESHPDGVWWIELAPVREPDLVPLTLARALGLREEEGRSLLDTISGQIAGSEILLVLDNCEQVLDASARAIEHLLHAAPRLRVLATSREPLGIPGEKTWRVPSLDEITASQLFIERASQVRPSFAPGEPEREIIAQICRRLDGIPLAVELAAARMRMMAPARIAAGLDDRFRLLTGGGRTVMPRQQTLETSVAWSHDLLDESERAMLRRLSVFASGFTIDAAERVCADEMIDSYAVMDLLSRLVDKSLVQVEDAAESDRYRLIETVRLYARERLAETDEANPTRDRHLAFSLKLAEDAEPELMVADGPAWLARLDRELDNFRAALEWAHVSRASAEMLRLATALTLFWEMRGHLPEGGRWLARALDLDDGPSIVRARALWAAAHVAVYGGDFPTAMRRAPEALTMAESLGDDWATARALTTLGCIRLWSEPGPAREMLARSTAIGVKIEDAWAIADGLKMITVTWLMQENFTGIEESSEELRRAAEHLGNRFFLAWYHCAIGWTCTHRGDFARARKALNDSLTLCDEVGEPATGGIALSFLAEIEAATGDPDAATSRVGAFMQRATATGGALGVPYAIFVLAKIALGRGEPQEARSLVEPLIEQIRPLGLPLYMSSALLLLGDALFTAGDDVGARAAFEEAREHAMTLDNPMSISAACRGLARVARRARDHAKAEDLEHAALSLRASAGLRPDIAESLVSLAALAADHESFIEAARLLGAAAALREAIGFVLLPALEREQQDEISRVRDPLGNQAFDAGYAEGRQLSIKDAIAYATRARGERKRPSSGWASLTPTEERVVALAAEGLMNAQIAQRLFISAGTVKVHLGHIFAKLGMQTRAELAAEATRRALSTGAYGTGSANR